MEGGCKGIILGFSKLNLLTHNLIGGLRFGCKDSHSFICLLKIGTVFQQLTVNVIGLQDVGDEHD